MPPAQAEMVLELDCGDSHYPLLPGWVNEHQQKFPPSAVKSDVKDRWDLRRALGEKENFFLWAEDEKSKTELEPELEGAARRNLEIPNKSPNPAHKTRGKRESSA